MKNNIKPFLKSNVKKQIKQAKMKDKIKALIRVNEQMISDGDERIKAYKDGEDYEKYIFSRGTNKAFKLVNEALKDIVS